jgi:hypothetical protein
MKYQGEPWMSLDIFLSKMRFTPKQKRGFCIFFQFILAFSTKRTLLFYQITQIKNLL